MTDEKRFVKKNEFRKHQYVEVVTKGGTMRHYVFVFLATLILCGCATSKWTQTGPIYTEWTGTVKVLEEMPADGTYEEIGWVSSSGGYAHEWTHLIKAMQKKAAMKGANAIVITRQDQNRISSVTYNQTFGLVGSSGTTKSLTSIAIRVNE